MSEGEWLFLRQSTVIRLKEILSAAFMAASSARGSNIMYVLSQTRFHGSSGVILDAMAVIAMLAIKLTLAQYPRGKTSVYET